MSDIKNRQSLRNLSSAIERLNEALKEPQDNKLAVDGTIQRFEFVIELCWKTLKRLLAEEGVITTTPRDTLKQAYSMKWIHDETRWLQFLQDRNLASHIYDEKTALKIYNNIKAGFPEFERICAFLKDRITEI